MNVVDDAQMSALRSESAFDGRFGVAATPAFGRQKINPGHLERLAIVYVRQSDPQQVLKHRESTALQYNLVNLAVELGWPRERVLIIDEDQGITGQYAEGRLGFQRVMAEVALNHVGIILGREMSRLARSCKDWYQLLEVCGLFGTVLGDPDGVYDPTDYHDRLLLGLTGIMSEAELHIMRGRLLAGLINKARRGELFNHLPMGYVLLSSGEVVLDPDEQAQSVARLVFKKFDELGSITSLLRYLARHDIRLGIRPHKGPNRGQLEWRRPSQMTLRNMLHHPMYAGAYVYGRRKVDHRRKVAGRPATGRTQLPRDQWLVLLKNRHPAYITWEQFESNQRRLEDNRARAGNLGAPREGSSLLGGLLVCGRCGGRMIVSYAGAKTRLTYVCQHQRDSYGLDRCQRVAGKVLDELVARHALKVLEPAALDLSLAAMEDIERERQRLERHWAQRRERALLEQRALEEEYARFQRAEPTQLTESDRRLIQSLATDIPALWNAPEATPADRQVILRHLIDRIVVDVHRDTEVVDVTIHWAGGLSSQHQVIRPVARYEQLQDFDRLKARIAELHQAGWNSQQIGRVLNREGFRPPRRATRYNGEMVRQILSRYLGETSKLAGRTVEAPLDLLRNEWHLNGLAQALSIPKPTLYGWLRRGWVHARKASNIGGCRWVIWADAEERERLVRLHACPLGISKAEYCPSLTNPRPRTEL